MQKCCTCNNIHNSLIPGRCLRINGQKGHRLCNHCWFNTFAIEGADHSCPGCNKGLPLTSEPEPEMIDLTN